MVEHVQWASIKLLPSITKYITLRRFSVLLDKLKLSRYVFWQKDILTCAKYFFCFNFAGSLMIDPMLDWCSGIGLYFCLPWQYIWFLIHVRSLFKPERMEFAHKSLPKMSMLSNWGCRPPQGKPEKGLKNFWLANVLEPEATTIKLEAILRNPSQLRNLPLQDDILNCS